jgi:CRISPR-associated Csx10 family RAMP protein
MKKITLKLKTPLLAGGRYLVGNFLTTQDFISGAVMRASFAREILRNCMLYDIDKADATGRYNWVYIRDEGRCKSCKYYKWCSQFEKLKFSNFYYEGTKPFPLSAMKCKYNDDHGIVDILINHFEKCPECGERIEFATGFYKGKELIKIPKRLITRTAIDYITKTAKEGSLYSIVVIEEGSIFEGYIDGADDLEFPADIRIGADTSSGLGKCELLKQDNIEKNNDLEKRIKDFNKYVNEITNNKEYKTYISFDLYSDLIININDKLTAKTTQEFKDLWKKILKLNFDYEIIKVYSESNLYRGYDTSRPWNMWRKETQSIIDKGSVIMIGTNIDLNKIIDELKAVEKNGIGPDTKNGYGDVIICDKIHLNGGISK